MASQTGTLTATGTVTLTKPATDTLTVATIAGTAYTTCSFAFQGSADGTNYFALAAIRYDTGALVTGTISPSDSSEQAWKIPSEGLVRVRMNVTGPATGSADFTLTSGSYVGQPFTSVSNTTGSSLAAQTFTGDVTLSGGTDLTFTGTTGQPQINLTDNLADSLSICEAANDYLVFVTTDSSEGITVGQTLTMANAKNIAVNTSTGTKIGTAATQKLGFFNATPVVQYNTQGDQTTGAAGSTTTVFLNTTFTGNVGSTAYKLGDIVAALKTLGLIGS